MRKTKILMIGTTDSIGGAARVGWNIGGYINKNKYDVKYIVGYKQSTSKNVYELRKPFLTSKIDSLLNTNTTSIYRHFIAFLTANDLTHGASDEILNHPWYRSADIIHLHNLHGNYFDIRTLTNFSKDNKRIVWSLHDMWPLTANCVYCNSCADWNKGKHFTFSLNKYGMMLWNNCSFLWNEKKKIYDSCRLRLVPSSRWLNSYVNQSILKKHKSTVILNSVDTKVFKPGIKKSAKEKLNIPVDKKVVMFIAHNGLKDKRKGGDYFLSVALHFEEKEDYIFLCVGGKNRYNKDNVNYYPFNKKTKDIATFYQASDVLIFPSLADNCPHVPIEAMATGLPVVSFDVGGVKEIVTHKKGGYVTKSNTTDSLIKGLKWIFDMSNLDYESMRQFNINEVKNKFSVDLMVNKYTQVYDNK